MPEPNRRRLTARLQLPCPGPLALPRRPQRPSVPLLALIALLGCSASSAQPTARAEPLLVVQDLLRRGDAAQALAAAERELTLQPGDAELRFARAVALMDLQRSAEAAQAFTALAEEFPELADPWNNLALLHARAGEPERARQALQTALRNDPTHRTARLNLGEVYLMLAAQSWEGAARLSTLEPAWTRRLKAVHELLGSPLPSR